MDSAYIPPAVARPATFGMVEQFGWYVIASVLVVVAGFLLFTYLGAKRRV